MEIISPAFPAMKWMAGGTPRTSRAASSTSIVRRSAHFRMILTIHPASRAIRGLAIMTQLFIGHPAAPLSLRRAHSNGTGDWITTMQALPVPLRCARPLLVARPKPLRPMLFAASSIGHAPTDRRAPWCSGIELADIADNESATVTGTYQISGAGITTTGIQATDPGHVNFSGAFTQANNSDGNYVKFSAIQAT